MALTQVQPAMVTGTALTGASPTVTSGTLTLASGGVTFSDASTQTSTSLGYSQTWQNVTGSRSLGTTYTNSTGRPICVVVSLSQNNSGIGHQVYVGSISYNAGQNNSTGGITTSSYTIVPNGISYYVSAQAGESIGTWVELR